MSEEQNLGSAQPNGAVSGDHGGKEQDGSAAVQNQPASNRGESRLLGKVKSLKQQLHDLESLSQSLQLEKLEIEGNKDKTIDHLKNELMSAKTALKAKDQAYAFATLGSQVKTEAAKMGCQDPDSLLKLMDLKGIPVDPETFTGDTDSIRMTLEEQKKMRPFYFGKAAPNVMDVGQSNSVLQQPSVDFSKMSREELTKFIKENGDKL